MKTQLKGNEQRSLHDKAKDGRLVNNNINFSLCKSIDRSDYVPACRELRFSQSDWNVEKNSYALRSE